MNQQHTAFSEWKCSYLCSGRILLQKSQTFQHLRRGRDWTPPVTGPGRTHGPLLEGNFRQDVKCMKFFQDVCGPLILCFNQLLIPSTLANTVAYFYAPDELWRLDFWVSSFSRRTLQSSPGTKATQVLTSDPSHAPSAIFPGMSGMLWWPNANSELRRGPSGWRTSAELG